MTQTFRKKRLEIIVEEPILGRLTDALIREKVTGYTIVPALGGYGSAGPWHRENALSRAGHMVVLVCILDERLVETVLSAAYGIVSRQIGIVTLSDVEVVRPDLF
tara:strand:- start:1382 stop:1696 length:315 start_codon:yes stop_codon:yes gene_type:complete